VAFPSAWLPQSVLSLRRYDRATFLADLLAGVTVGLVALPLAMAFAISSGVPPQAGLACAVVAGFTISALGGTRLGIGGPTGAFVVVVSGIVAQHGFDGLLLCTFMAGIILVVLGATGLGTAVDYLPRPVLVGFTNGIAVLIASTQVRDFLGLRLAHPSGLFLPRLVENVRGLPTWTPAAAGLGVAALVVVLFFNRFVRRVPGVVAALVLGTAAAWALGLPVETVGSRFGDLPAGLPRLEPLAFRPDLIHPLLGPALTVALLGAVESLMSASVADRMAGGKHNPNVELVAQGAGNLLSPLFGGLPATGAIARTAINIRAGGRTPVAGMIHALTLLGVLVFAAPLARHVPLAVLAAILLVVAWNMGEWAEIPELLRLSRADVAVWLVTFGLTVFADLTVAVQAGMILAGLLFIRRIAETTTISEITTLEIERDRVHVLQDKVIPDYVAVFRIHGPFLFGASEKIEEILDRVDRLPPIVILRLRNMTAIDTTGLRALDDLSERLHATGRTLIMCGARPQPARLIRRAGIVERVGPRNVCDHVREALDRAREIHEQGRTAEGWSPEPGR
jgi:SulP family sulfate permease